MVKKKDKHTEQEENEIARQVKEIEERLSDISNEMNSIDAKMKRYQIEAKRAELTNRELDRLADDSIVYRQIGRMWITQPKKGLVENLKAMEAVKVVEGAQMQQMRRKLEEKARSEAAGLQELIGETKFKEIFAKQGEVRADPSQTLADMGKKEDGAMPLFGKRAASFKDGAKALDRIAEGAEDGEGEKKAAEPAPEKKEAKKK